MVGIQVSNFSDGIYRVGLYKILLPTLFPAIHCVLSGQASLSSHSLNMATRNINNVYRGEDSLRNYFDPDQQPMIPMVELPQKLNPFYEDGVRVYAKMMSTLPANNIKCLPGMLSWAVSFPSTINRL